MLDALVPREGECQEPIHPEECQQSPWVGANRRRERVLECLSATIFRMATEGSPADKAMAERYADAPEVDAHRLWRLIVMAFDDLYRCVLDRSKTNEFSNYYRILSQ